MLLVDGRVKYKWAYRPLIFAVCRRRPRGAYCTLHLCAGHRLAMVDEASRSVALGVERAAGELDRKLGERVRARRHAIGMSQERLADLVGITFQQVQKYEMGFNRIAASRLIDIAVALETPVAYSTKASPSRAESPRRALRTCWPSMARPNLCAFMRQSSMTISAAVCLTSCAR